MSKGSTAQELFVICTPENIEKVKKNILLNVEKYLIKS
jgi:hypothetical protein